MDKSLLRNIALLEGVPDSALESLAARSDILEMGTGGIVIERDDGTTEAYLVVTGRVQVVDYIDDRPPVLLGEIAAGGHFGEMSAIAGTPRSARVVTAEPTKLVRVPAAALLDLLDRSPFVGLRLLRDYIGLIRLSSHRVTELTSATPHQRVYGQLLRMAEPDAQKGGWVIRGLPTHGDLAIALGIGVDVVGKAIGELARGGVVMRRHRDMVIRDRDRLSVLARL